MSKYKRSRKLRDRFDIVVCRVSDIQQYSVLDSDFALTLLDRLVEDCDRVILVACRKSPMVKRVHCVYD